MSDIGDCRFFRLPKRGNSEVEYEDAASADPQRGRFAVADGATESGFALEWANILVKRFAVCDYADSWARWLPAAQQEWIESVGSRAYSSYYAEAKFEEGAHAAFLGLIAGWSDNIYRWNAMVVGDCCLFHTRSSELLTAFPIEESAAFNNRPRLVGSRYRWESVEEKTDRRVGEALSNDCFWLATDALAAWMIKEREEGRSPWLEMESILGQQEPEQRFAVWIEDLRDAGRIRNDDVTLLAVTLK